MAFDPNLRAQHAVADQEVLLLAHTPLLLHASSSTHECRTVIRARSSCCARPSSSCRRSWICRWCASTKPRVPISSRCRNTFPVRTRYRNRYCAFVDLAALTHSSHTCLHAPCRRVDELRAQRVEHHSAQHVHDPQQDHRDPNQPTQRAPDARREGALEGVRATRGALRVGACHARHLGLHRGHPRHGEHTRRCDPSRPQEAARGRHPQGACVADRHHDGPHVALQYRPSCRVDAEPQHACCTA